MRLAITGASGHVGRHLLSALDGSDIETFALVRTETELPATHIIPDWIHSKAAEDANWDADYIVHLAGSMEPPDGNYDAANVKPTEAVLSSIAIGKQQRIVYLSCLGADAHSRNAYLAAKGRAEDLLTHGVAAATIFRCAHIIGTPAYPGPTASHFITSKGRTTLLGAGRQRMKPLYVGDVVAAILAALQPRGNGIYPLAGPDEMSLDELVRLVNYEHRVRLMHIPAAFARVLPLIDRHYPPALVDFLLADRTTNCTRALTQFHLTLTSLRDVWQAPPASATELSTAA
jgi:NADH dehydrogenase